MSDQILPDPDPDKGKGQEQQRQEPQPAPEVAAAPSAGRDRAKLASEVELNPLSLAGSWFHRLENGEIVWDGIVVGEAGGQDPTYILHVRKGLDGLEHAQAQVLLPLSKLTAKDEGYEFRFFDTKDQMIEAYAEYVVGQGAAFR